MKRFSIDATWSRVFAILIIVTSAIAMNVASPANAGILNVAWRGEGSNTRVSYTGLGAATDLTTNTYWNNLDTSGQNDSTLFSNLVYSNNSAATGVSIQLNGVNSYTPGGAALALFNGQINAKNDGYTTSIDIQGLDDTRTYDLYLYSGRADQVTPTTFTVGGVAQSLNGSKETSMFIPKDGDGNGNYVVYSSLSPVSGGINIAVTGAWGGQFNGFQLVVPEPASMALLATGLLGLLAYAWRRK